MKSDYFASEAVTLLPQIFSIVSRSDQYETKGLELSVPQLRFMNALNCSGESTMTEVSETLRIAAPSATMTADRLVKQGLIYRKRDVNDRRVVRIGFTPKGKRVMNKFIHAKQDRWEKIMNSLSDAEQDTLITTLRRLLSLLQKADFSEANVDS